MCRNRIVVLRAFCLVGLFGGAALGAGCNKTSTTSSGLGDPDAAVTPESGTSGGAGNSGAGASASGGSAAGSRAGAAGKTSAGGSGGSPSAGAAGSDDADSGVGEAGAGASGSSAGAGAGEGGAGASAGEGGAGAGGRGGRGGSGRGGSGRGGSAGNSGSGGNAGSAGNAGRGGNAGSAAGSGGATGGRCGTRGGVQCGGDQFCNFEPDVDCGGTDRGGACEDKPEVCTTIYNPVCGCDDKTYSSDCVAHAAGVSVKSEGVCETASTGETCGGIAALECDTGYFCNYEAAAGGQGCGDQIADAAGKCDATPSGCTRDLRPVCGCDHRSYNNVCEAHAAGISVLHDGGCTQKDCAAISGRVAYGLGPAPMCDADETEHGYVVADNGAMFIEGALCCLGGATSSGDDTATPGDDRAGYVVCAGTSACESGARCCSAATAMCTTAANCGAPTSLGATCDGPEDCTSGQKCLAGRNGRTCGAAASSPQSYTVCHKSEDCAGATCPGSGTPCTVCVADSAGGSATCLGQ